MSNPPGGWTAHVCTHGKREGVVQLSLEDFPFDLIQTAAVPPQPIEPQPRKKRRRCCGKAVFMGCPGDSIVIKCSGCPRQFL